MPTEEKNQSFIERKETELLNYLENNPLKNFMDGEKAEFNKGRESFIALSKLFEHNTAKLAQATRDWLGFMDTLREKIATECFLLDMFTSGEDSPDTKENSKNFIARQESELLNLIRTNHLGDYLNREAARFDFHRKNFTRLSERFELFGDMNFAQISSCWVNYIKVLNQAIKQSLITDFPADAFTDSKDDLSTNKLLYITRQKMEQSFKDLLGADYLDFEKPDDKNLKSLEHLFK